MTTLSTLSAATGYQAGSAARAGTVAGSTGPVPAAVSTASPSSAVVLSGRANGALVQLYSADGTMAAVSDNTVTSGPFVWESRQTGAISSLMAGDAVAGDLAGRWHGLGKALLDHIKDGGGSFSQSVLQSWQAVQADEGVQAILRQQLHDFAGNGIGLSVVTAGGAKVNFSLSADSNGIAVKVEVAEGKLADDEREAIGGLGDAFQAAVNGLAEQPPRLALEGLLKFDTAALASIDLHAALGGGDQAIDFHADAGQRTLSTSGAAGAIKVAVDLNGAAIAGSARQRQDAIASYLEQFDAAARRGHGDESLNALFKDAFAQLNSSYPGQASKAGQVSPAVGMEDADRKMLTGLADFTASVSGTTRVPNPLDHGEVDSFDYRVSQRTTLGGGSQANRHIVQQQQSSLHAAYHEPLHAGAPLKLTTDKQSQNYTYRQIDDEASSTLEIAYDKGFLARALLRQSASQQTHVTKYVLGKKVSDITTPSQSSIVRDFTAQLRDAAADKERQAAGGEFRWEQMLSLIGSLSLLKQDPAVLKRQAALPLAA
ncbi:hypothetical protein [Herbaspirillum sp.]|uniref:hypothetical protein n=1 Tax=Herbaspirillum sp. TaxID=1890675 RepID=UPI001B034F64|nr:hypothetical protein [Herbaspirillum sp.]MBO9537026.1 hypothetical protein [Herbaspirillum sp.]